jgi:adenylosuccinate lyase
MMTAFENVPLWHERDISHSSAERIIIPDGTILLDYMLHRFAGVLERLVVFEDRMKANIDLTHGLVFSQRIMLALIDKQLSREQAYDMVQPLAMQAWESGEHLKTLLLQDESITRYLSHEELEAAFDAGHHTKHVEELFRRVGL